MTTTKNLIFQDQRLVILKSLMDCGNDANENILRDCLALYGHRISQSLLRNHLLFLEEQDLIHLRKIGKNDLYVAMITRTGEDVANGVTMVDGVKKPRPEF